MTTKRACHIESITKTYKGKTYVSHLLRHTYRENGKVKHLTLGNLSDLPDDLIQFMRKRLAGEPLPSDNTDDLEIARSLPHGNVAATLGTLRKIGLDDLISSKPCREAQLVVAMIVLRVIAPASKLANLTSLQSETSGSSLRNELHLEHVDTPELYTALDWLLKRQTRIENKLAKKHLKDGTLVLYDVSSSYYTGRRSELIQHGYSRDGKPSQPQIVYGLLCASDGCPVAIEVFPGNTADPTTFSAQVNKVRRRFGLTRVVMVGDRGMITSKRINEDLRDVEGLEWISALRSDGIKKLVKKQSIAKSLFDEQDLAEISSLDFPDERLIVCRNPLLADKRARMREELLAAAEKKLEAIAQAVSRDRQPLRGKDKIGMRVGRELKQSKMQKHFELTIEDDKFSYERKQEQIAAEAALDGLYVVRTSVPTEVLSSEQAVSAYKGLSQVERAFRSLKSVDLHIRPIFHWKDERIKAHVFLCMLAYYLEWHMRGALAELLFDDHEREAAEASRTSIVGKAPRSPEAKQKEHQRRTADGYPVQSFQSLLKDLATLCQNTVRWRSSPSVEFTRMTLPTPLHRRVFELLGISI
ncbi:MAG: IS1634 family transposase [Planctomycetales bacterium]|nr:IS1634 family transposase [Planctomycetales bacterium]